MRNIRYRQLNVRETLVELKDTSEHALDLAYAALLSDDAELAAEVIRLESRVDYLEYQAQIALMLAANRVSDAERLVGVFQVVDTAVEVTHAAGDIARILTKNIGHPSALRVALPEAPEVADRVVVADGSPYAGQTLGEIDLQVETGVRVVAIRRDDEWQLRPDADATVEVGDVLIASGADAGIETFHERATGASLITATAEPTVDDLSTAVDLIVELKTISEVSVGLAYSAALFDSDAIASEVRTLEERSDELESKLEAWVIDAVPTAENPHELRGLLQLANAAEETCDAAFVLAETVLRDVELHPVFGQAVKESAEVITTATVGPESELIGDDVAELELETRTGMVVLAVRREGTWTFDPKSGMELMSGDALVARGPRGGEQRLRELCQG